MDFFFSTWCCKIQKFIKQRILKVCFTENIMSQSMSFKFFFPFQIRTEDPDLPDENQARANYRAIAYSSLSQSYLYIEWTPNYKPVLVGEHLNVVVTPKSPYIDKITHYNYLVSMIMTDLQQLFPHLFFLCLQISIRMISYMFLKSTFKNII